MSTVAVTGARGLLGRTVVDGLHSRGHDVVRLGRADDGRQRRLDEDHVGPLLAGVDAIVHLAARLVDDPSAPVSAYLEPNVALCDQLVGDAVEAGVRGFVLASSRLVYSSSLHRPATEADRPAPELAYGLSKWFAELTVAHRASGSGLRHTSLRISQLFGHGDPDRSLLATFARCAAAGRPLVVAGGGSAVRDFLDVRDAAHAAVLSAEHLLHAPLPAAINVGGGPMTVRELAETAVRAFERSDDLIVDAGGPTDDSYWALDCTLAEESIGWTPRIDLVSALRDRARMSRSADG